ncbi:uncharacterized protein LOC144552717 isoform X2 [Carex rostrata]
MHPPTNQTESETPSSSNTSSRSTQNVPSRIGRVITRAVSTILPSSSNRQSNRATGSIPASGLSSILSRSSQYVTVQPNLSSRRVVCEPTSPDALLHARQPTLGANNAPGGTSSQVTDKQQSLRKETLPNPILRRNLHTITPSIMDARVTAPRVTSNYSRKLTFSAGASTSTNPALRNPIPTVRYPHKDKRGTSTRLAWIPVVPSPVSSNSKPSVPSSDGIITRTGPILRPTPLQPNSAGKVAGLVSSQAAGYSKLNNFTSDQPHPQNMVPNVSAKKSLVKVTACDPKGKTVAAVGNQATKRKALKQRIKDNYISSRDQDQPDLAPIPLGEKCQLCAIDLAFLPCNSSSGTSTDPPICAILPCGHALHASCLEQVYGSSLEPHCLSCA